MDKIAQLQEMIDESTDRIFGGQEFPRVKYSGFRSSDGVYSVQVGRHLTAEQLVSHTIVWTLSRGLSTFTSTYLQMPSPMLPISIVGSAWRYKVAPGSCDTKVIVSMKWLVLKKFWSSMAAPIAVLYGLPAILWFKAFLALERFHPLSGLRQGGQTW